MQTVVHDLGTAIDRTWRETDRAPEAFQGVALGVLAAGGAAAARRAFGLDALLPWFAEPGKLPAQLDAASNFGQPPVTVFRDPDGRFVIDVLCWLTPDTSIHDHGFSGACLVLAGQTLHTEYAFAAEERPGDGVALGHLRATTTKVLEPGDSFGIASGEGFVHKTTHLAVPTVSLVVRTICDEGVAQHTYFPPGLALRYSSRGDVEVAKGVRYWRFLRECGDTAGAAAMARILVTRDEVLKAVLAAMAMADLAGDDADPDFWLAPLVERHGEWARSLVGTFATHRARKALAAAPGADTEPRFLASALDSYGWRPAAAELVRGRYPGQDPAEVVGAGLAAMASTGRLKGNVAAYAGERLAATGAEDEETIEMSGIFHLLTRQDRALLAHLRL